MVLRQAMPCAAYDSDDKDNNDHGDDMENRQIASALCITAILALLLIVRMLGAAWPTDGPSSAGRIAASDAATPASDVSLVGPQPASSASSLYQAYVATYLQPDGRVISNAGHVDWCPNSCIGCDRDTTSEGIARMAHAASLAGDKATFDTVNAYAMGRMRHPRAGFLMWKLDAAGKPGGCGGENSAVDAELIMIGALLDAQQRWGGAYAAEARSLMDALKSGIIDGKYVPSCMQEREGRAAPCAQTVFLGYVNLPVLKRMCGIDSFWCQVHGQSKALLIAAVQGKGVYSTVYLPDRWAWENADIQPNHVMKYLATDGDEDAWQAVQPLYAQGRDLFMANRAQGKAEICQEFHPDSGCKVANPPLRVYANYLEMAKARNDAAFADELRKYIGEKIAALAPLAGEDNYGNVVVLEALG